MLLIVVIPVLTFGWGKNGHRIVGQIAMKHMNNKALKNTKAILGDEDIAISANWMDFIKSESEYDYMKPWHYVTIPDSGHYHGAPEEGDAFEAINKYIEELKTKNFSIDEAHALKCLIHIIGDVHQPLHVGNGTDRGGNDVKVKFFWEKSNLHRVWDSGIIDNEQLSYTEYANWIDIASPDEITKWQSTPVMDWLLESKQMRSMVYKIPESKNLSYLYVHDNVYELNKRLLQAGIRLAGILNELYG